MATALIVDNNAENLLSLAEVFRANGYATETANDLRAAREALLKRMPEVAMLDEHVGERDTLELLEELDLAPVMEIYLMSEKLSVKSATRAMRVGVTDYFGKPVDMERLENNLQELTNEISCEVEEERADKSGRGLLVGESLPMHRMYRLIRKTAPSEASILLVGESGSGKEVVARTIHDLSERAACEFVGVNCSAVPRELMESELFGHKKGSFTGATHNRRGLFEVAAGGTLFLDEISEMDSSLQAKLLRVLEARQVRPVGGEEEITVDARIIAATNQDPQAAVGDGRLREDLYYRLAQVPIRVPSLRERGADVRLLAQHFLDEQNNATGVTKTFSDGVLEAFKLHDWPGNVRELKNAVVHGHLLAGTEIKAEDLPDDIPSTMPVRGQFVRITVGTPLSEVERRHILSTLAHLDGDKKKAAAALGISLKTLYNRLKQYGVQ